VECEDFASSLAEKKAACRGKDTVGTGWRRTIGHLCLGNFRRRLARVYVISSLPFKWPLYMYTPFLDKRNNYGLWLGTCPIVSPTNSIHNPIKSLFVGSTY
jgi:hypothetical protein